MQSIHYPFKDSVETGEPFQINQQVSLLRLPIPDNLKYINCYILHGQDGDYIYDTGMATPAAKDIWQKVIDAHRYNFQGIIISHHHPDHLGLANWLQQQLAVPVYMDQQEVAVIENIIQDTRHPSMPAHFESFFNQFDMSQQQIEGYFQLMQGINLLHSGLPEQIKHIEDCPLLQQESWQLVKGQGHSVNVCCFYSPEHKLLLSSDQVLPEISSIVYASWTREQINPLADWLDSIERFMGLLPDDVMVLPSHKHVFYGLHQRLTEIADLHYQRLEQTRELLQEYDYHQITKITQALFQRELKSLPDLFMASGETLAHVEYLLVEQGQSL